MASKRKRLMTTEAESFPRKSIRCESGPADDEKGLAFANLITSPELAAHRIVSMMQPKVIADDIDAPGMLKSFQAQAAAVQSGDLAYVEAMLVNQASALQSVFVRLSERAIEQTQMPNFEGFMRLALRAQSQCRATLETLATIKNPPIVYAGQANVTTGPQQINNGTVENTRARENQKEQTQLSRETHGLLPNTRAQGDASQIDQTLETLGKINRAKNR